MLIHGGFAPRELTLDADTVSCSFAATSVTGLPVWALPAGEAVGSVPLPLCSAVELAEVARLGAALVRRTLNLTLLSPELQRAILRGEEPEGLSLSWLRETMPMDWEAQVEFLSRTADSPE